MKDKPEIERFVPVKAVAAAFSCSEQHIYDLLSTGELRGIRLGSRAIRISVPSINTFVENNRINPEDCRIDPAEEEIGEGEAVRHTEGGSSTHQKEGGPLGGERKVARSNWMSIDRLKG